MISYHNGPLKKVRSDILTNGCLQHTVQGKWKNGQRMDLHGFVANIQTDLRSCNLRLSAIRSAQLIMGGRHVSTLIVYH